MSQDLNGELSDKVEVISKAIQRCDFETLKAAALSSKGLLNDSIRRLVWPQLCHMNCENDVVQRDRDYFDLLDPEKNFIDHPDWSVIVADVHRSVMWFDPDEDVEDLKTKLTLVIMAVLLDDHDLCYFQGFNVVCAVILRVMSNSSFEAFRLAKLITNTHFRHLMLDRKGERMWDFLSYIFPIIGRVNISLRRFLESADLRENVCISWILTWLGYHIGSISLEEICRLFDFFLAMGDPYMPVYFSASLILLHADGITSCHPEMTEVFQYVKQIPDSIPFDTVIADSIRLRENVPLSSVQDEANDLIRMRSEQQQLIRQNPYRRQPVKYFGVWQLAFSLYRSQQARAIAASTIALGFAYFYTRNPDIMTNLMRLLRRCASSATVNVVGIDVDLLLG